MAGCVALPFGVVGKTSTNIDVFMMGGGSGPIAEKCFMDLGGVLPQLFSPNGEKITPGSRGNSPTVYP